MRPRLPFVALAACIAACAPSTFDNLSGGAAGEQPIKPHAAEFNTADKSLDGKDPRPVGPFSTSWVNTSKPHFKWVLQPGTTGAMLELSRTRDFKDVAKRIPVTGSDHPIEAAEALETGVWFWRLSARTASGQSTTHSPVWEVLVRGPSARGESAAPRGGFYDGNGDGVADFLLAVVGNHQIDDKGTLKAFPDVLGFLAIESSPGVVTYDPTKNVYAEVGEEGPAIAAGFDSDGDGFGDFTVATVFPPNPPMDPGPSSDVYTTFGSLVGYDDAKGGDYYFEAQQFTTVPTLAAGDFNGDGYGDLSAMLPTGGTTFLGGTLGFASMLQFASPIKAETVSLAVGSSDLDGDGIYDLAFTPFEPTTPLQVVLGATTRFGAPTTIAAGGSFAPPGRAIAMASGDFDGDAVEEIAFTTTLTDGKAAVCVHSMAKPALNAHGCWVSAEPAAGFGLTLKAADLDADGRDELLVSTATGIIALTHAGNGYDGDDSTFTPTPITGPFAPRFTVVHPGRPGKARWIAMGTDQSSVYIHEGIGEGSLKQTIDFRKMNKKDYDFVRMGTSIR